MRFKLDENLGPSIQACLNRRGLDARSVMEEGLGGAEDQTVLRAATAEGRILITMDQDFGNVLLHSPDKTSGVAVLDPRGRASRSLLQSMVEALVTALEQHDIRGKLWIVEPSRIRERESGIADPLEE
jgi:predicted nuclease of predicted toxin-antitoxin system